MTEFRSGALGMGGRGSSSLKEAIQRRERGGDKRAAVSKLEYMDTM